VFRHSYNPLRRNVDPVALCHIAVRLAIVSVDFTKPKWLQNLALTKSLEAHAFSRVGFLEREQVMDSVVL